MQVKIHIDKKDETLLSVWFADLSSNHLIQQIEGRRFSRTRKCWIVPNNRHNVIQIARLFGKENCTFSREVILKYKPNATEEEIQKHVNNPSKKVWTNKPVYNAETFRHPIIVEVVRHMQIRNYSYKSIQNYRTQLIMLIHYFNPDSIATINKEQFEKYLDFLVNKKRLSASSINVVINSFKYYRENLLGEQKYEHFELPKILKARQLPQVLSQIEVERILLNTRSKKYKALFSFIYSAGLRLNEAINIKMSDINRYNKTIFIKNGKGKKDRYVILSPKVHLMLQEYYKEYRPKEYLFENDFNNEPLGARSVQIVFDNVVQQSGIRKKTTIHTLRHSYATHLLESGVDVRHIKELLGHADLNTTLRYTHVFNKDLQDIVSPFDRLNIR
jgi:integrase/recombinase XerD